MAHQPHDAHITRPEEHPENHEQTDVHIKPIAIGFAILTVIILGSVFGLVFLFNSYDRDSKSQNLPAVADGIAVARNPAEDFPHLQGIPGFGNSKIPRDEMDAFRKEQEAKLNHYTVNPDGKTIQVPIAKAIDMALDKNIFPLTKTSAVKPGTLKTGAAPSTLPTNHGETAAP